MIDQIKAQLAIIKANKALSIILVSVGFVAGAFLIGPLAAGIQYLKDMIK